MKWHTILLEVAIIRLVHRGYEGHVDGCGEQQYSGRLWHLHNAQLVLRGPKVHQENIPPTPLHHYTTSSNLQYWLKEGYTHAFMLFCSRPYHPNVTAEDNIFPHNTTLRLLWGVLIYGMYMNIYENQFWKEISPFPTTGTFIIYQGFWKTSVCFHQNRAGLKNKPLFLDPKLSLKKAWKK